MLPANPPARRRCLKLFNAVVCSLGVLVSVYAYVVETRAEHDPKYAPMCDISPRVSCTVAFNSRYGKGMGLFQRFVSADSILIQPNSVYGIIFYAIVFICGMPDGKRWDQVHFALCVLSNITSVYLAYILYFILYDLCVVCVTTYVCNALLLAGSICRKRVDVDKSKKKA
ncbi:hypothetical protein V5799_020725 [Amblyomma americanum]|uniref:vitamin-K-epoxide reductase (warfarin-sensitive) n=1 Tax=Amblyomma americanum TaxID=6943 RepID=A0AAQ4ET11_AMBAM